MPFISIFIPAYKNVNYFKRLLDSIISQDFSDFEVIVTDDSPDMEIENVFKTYQGQQSNWRYIRNAPALGMPDNWNKGLSLCLGEWIKIMHDDDWFSGNESLRVFAEKAKRSKKKFLFSAFSNIYTNNKVEKKNLSSYRHWLLKKETMSLLSDNVIGAPSVCMVHHTIKEIYDNRFRWRVDVDYYIRVLNRANGFEYIDSPLINIGISNEQVTNEVKYDKSIELSEAYLLLEKYGYTSLKNVVVYDSWWRIMRNLNVETAKELQIYSQNREWPMIIQLIVRDLNRSDKKKLRNGMYSKVRMLKSYWKVMHRGLRT